MTALTELTNEQLEYLCERIPQKVIVDYFNSNSKEYNKIWKGRAQSLKRDRIVWLLVTNINNPFIASFVEKCIGIWIAEIEDFRRNLEDNGATKDESLIRALPDSVFSNDIDLYFLLCGDGYPEEFISLVKNVLPLIPLSKESDDVSEESDEAIEEKDEIASLNNQLSEAQTQILYLQTQLSSEQSLREHCERELAASMETQAELKSSLTVLKEKLSETSHIKAELEQLQLLTQYADTDVSKEVEKEFAYTSICRIAHRYSDQVWLIRLADVYNGKISIFEQEENVPRCFGNRDRLFWKNGPDEDGYIGIWNWNAQPNNNDPDTDYVTTAYNGNMVFTEIIEVPTCHNISELSQYISSNQVSAFSGRKILFTLPAENSVIKGILCEENNFVKLGDKFKLNSSVYILPQFSIKSSDVISFAGMKIYQFTTLGLPETLAKIKDPMYVAKDIILSRAKSTVLRESGLTKKEAQHCRAFMDELPVNTIAKELADLYACCEDEAQSYINEFIEHANSYLCSEDLDVSIIASAIERNDSLVQLCKNMILDEWRQENAELVAQAEQELSSIKLLIASVKAEKADLELAKESLQKQLTVITEDIQSKEQLASNVEEKVATRIAAAKKNAADFICEMAFATNYGTNQVSTMSSYMPKVTQHLCQYTKGDLIDDRDTFEEELAENLEKSGYSEEYAYEMSQVISFCISNKLPLVVNENADIISDCIAAMFDTDGAMEVSLPLANSDCSMLCETIKANVTSDYNIFVINGIFDGFSLNAYNELLQNYSEIKQKALLILSACGLSMNMIPVSVWNQSFFIDGDLHLISVRNEPLNSFISNVDFKLSYDQVAIKAMRKELKPFREFVSNTAQLKNAMFMSTYDEHIGSCLLLEMQLILASQNSAAPDELISAFEATSVSEEGKKLISKYQ